MFASLHDSKGGNLQVTYAEKYEERVEGIFCEVLRMWRNLVSGLAFLLDNKKCFKFTKSGIKMLKIELKTGIIWSVLFYIRNGCYGFI